MVSSETSRDGDLSVCGHVSLCCVPDRHEVVSQPKPPSSFTVMEHKIKGKEDAENLICCYWNYYSLQFAIS